MVQPRGGGRGEGQSFPPYRILTIKLDSARTRIDLGVQGSYLAAGTDGTLAGIEIRLETEGADPIPLSVFNQFTAVVPWKTLFLTHTAQLGRTLTLLISDAAALTAIRDVTGRAPEPNGFPFCNIESFSTTSTSYTDVQSRVVGEHRDPALFEPDEGSVVTLGQLYIYTSTPATALFQFFIGEVRQFTNIKVSGNTLDVRFPPNTVPFNTLIQLTVKSDDGSAVAGFALIAGVER